MQKEFKKTGRIVLIIFFIIAVFVIARYYVFHVVSITIQHKLKTLNSNTGLHIRYDSFYVDWKKNIIVITAPVISKNFSDTTCAGPGFIAAKEVRVEGFHLLPFILQNRLSVEVIRFFEPQIVMRKPPGSTGAANPEENDLDIDVDKIYFTAAQLQYRDSACNIIKEFHANATASALHLDFRPGKPFLLTMKALLADSIEINLHQDFYTLAIQSVNIDFPRHILHLDTLKIIPHYGKIAFGRMAGYELDRVDGMIPEITIYGFTCLYPDTFAVTGKQAEIKMFLKVFHDKRLIHKKKLRLLPIQHLRQLPFGLQIDTLKVRKSYIEYEEFPDDAETTGKIFLDNLTATISNINSNAAQQNGQTIMHASASFLGDGDLDVISVFPWKTGTNYLMEGSLKNLSLSRINSMLVPQAGLKVESGTLKSLRFNFAYNAYRSDGTLKLNYNDLKLTSLQDKEKQENHKKKRKRKKDKNKEAVKDDLKSFIINTFVIRKNMDERVPEEKRTGTILSYRDTSRSVFNYWWKSLLSGIQSANNINNQDTKKKGRNDKRK